MSGATSSVRGCFSSCSVDGQKLANFEECNAFVSSLLLHGHILEADVKPLASICVAPISYVELLARLVADFATPHSRSIDQSFSTLFESIADVVGLFEFWKAEGFSEKQTSQQLLLLEQLCAENEAALAALANWRSSLDAKYGEEDLATLFWDRLLPAREPPLSPGEYHRQTLPRITKQLKALRIDRVFYPKFERVVVLGQTPIGTRTLGTSMDQQVDVLTVAMPVRDHAGLRSLLHEIEALRQLTLSPHFVNYRGTDDVTLPNDVQHFFEFVPRATRLSKIIHKYGAVQADSPLLSYWGHCALAALGHILHRCTLRVGPIPLHSLWIADDGLRLILRDLDWLAERPQCPPQEEGGMAAVASTYQDGLEAELVVTFGQILFFMLTATEPQSARAMPPLPLPPFLHGIVRTCLVASRRPRLDDLARHPFFVAGGRLPLDLVTSSFLSKVGAEPLNATSDPQPAGGEASSETMLETRGAVAFA